MKCTLVTNSRKLENPIIISYFKNILETLAETKMKENERFLQDIQKNRHVEWNIQYRSNTKQELWSIHRSGFTPI